MHFLPKYLGDAVVVTDPEPIHKGSIEITALRKLVYRLAPADREYDHVAEAASAVVERFQSLEEESEQLRDRLDKLGDIGERKTSKEEKIAAIVTFAARKKGEKPAITVKPKTIKGLIDFSRRYAYDLVDDMHDEYEWAHDPTQVDQYGMLEKDTSQKGILIDFDGVHGDPVPVNKFTTGTAEQGR
ncbi:hypothetical protein C499_05990 [Halogeometricum borinquense DSM 11551]|uniref:Uncharacterized protein n=1 Tax=Halogeometricum borinquense (strain ATCC 700274 / DSM 11551 / JCM 10706 / KCTC 4070 / PR3) TaxID=469382 RepID=E4NVC3_HALBP|nr:hypothetical protein [Halogeometricum borinquense]ADQ69112.1 hypothetical protein Hbor_35940 [Halogeometricum borinquense DSM 11551]ELY29385.1 hypothetical protein C499_05990 [Halogeometricum borinquense DSM 11551]